MKVEAGGEGAADPAVPREPTYYFDRVVSRIDRLETLMRASSGA